jgi:hypothetical protein
MRNVLLALAVLVACTAGAQTYSDQGLMGASGIVLFPTSTTSPKAQFRFHAGRMAFLGNGPSGVNVLGMSGGLSSHVEAYVRVNEDQSAPSGSLTSYGFGAKLRLPFPVPFAEQLSLWGETVSTEASPDGQLYPTNLVRAGMTVLLIQNAVRPQMFLGLSAGEGRTAVLTGAGITMAAGRSVQLGAEALYGYAGPRSAHVMLSGAVRLLSGVCLQLGGGYLATSRRGMSLLSLGLSIGTADIDFAPVVEEKKNEFRMPTLEEMEQQSREEGKP